MKHLVRGLVVLGVAMFAASAQGQADTSASVPAVTGPGNYQLKEQDQNHKIWERIDYEIGPGGTRRPHAHRYTELATGLSFWNGTQWQDSQELIEPIAGGAIARYGNHKVSFANNLADPGAIDLQSPEGKHLRSTIIGLSYLDTATGKSALIAEVKNCQGKIVNPNTVRYEDAFDDVDCSVRYIYTKAGFEQDVLVNSQLSDPAEWGLDAQTTVLQVLTEFFSPPQPHKTLQAIQSASGATLEDEDLDFGAMKFVQGKAFSVGEQGQGNDVPVARQWLKLDNRDVLVEQVPLPDLQSQLEALPKAEGASIKSSAKSVRRTASLQQALPSRLVEASPEHPHLEPSMKMQHAAMGRRNTDSNAPAMQTASLNRNNPCVVIDYNTMGVSATNFVFQSDTTYYISGRVNFTGTNNIIEGGTVVKYMNSPNDFCFFDAQSCVVSKAEPYRMAVFTSQNDDSVGEQISNSTGQPTTGSTTYLRLTTGASSTNSQLAYLRFAYAGCAVVEYAGIADTTVNPIWNCQFVKCGTAIVSGLASHNQPPVTVWLYNVLISQCGTVVSNLVGTSGFLNIGAVNTTVDQADVLLSTFRSTGGSAWLTNCILTGVRHQVFLYEIGYDLPLTTNACFIAPTNTGVYQTVAGGNYYLASNNIPCHGTGTSSINSGLLNELVQKTTHPPLLFTNRIDTPTIFAPQAKRDNMAGLDLGYHYDPIDYVFGGTTAATNLTFTAGTVMGWFAGGPNLPYGPESGISISDGVQVQLCGTPTQPCWVVYYNTVQERSYGPTRPYFYPPWGAFLFDQQSLMSGQLTARFTKWSTCAGGPYHLYDCVDGGTKASLTDSEFYNGSMYFNYNSWSFANCLFSRVNVASYCDDQPGLCVLQNCLFWNGALFLGGNYSNT
jgi:hypothetical protein